MDTRPSGPCSNCFQFGHYPANCPRLGKPQNPLVNDVCVCGVVCANAVNKDIAGSAYDNTAYDNTVCGACVDESQSNIAEQDVYKSLPGQVTW